MAHLNHWLIWEIVFVTVILTDVHGAHVSTLDKLRRYLERLEEEKYSPRNEALFDKRDEKAKEVIEEVPNPEAGEKKGCQCYCKSRYYNDNWYCCKCSWTENICFPGEAKVTLDSGDKIPMTDLKIGQKVLTASPDGMLEYSDVLAFLKKNPHQIGMYLRVMTTSGHVISLSKSHVIFMTKRDQNVHMEPRYAEELSVGDMVYTSSDGVLTPTNVTAIEKHILEGVYVPLTEHGTIIVDDIYTSCYASFDHHIAHWFMKPLRWFPWLLGSSDSDGTNQYVNFVKTIGRWILPSNAQDKTPRISTLFSGFQHYLTSFEI